MSTHTNVSFSFFSSEQKPKLFLNKKKKNQPESSVLQSFAVCINITDASDSAKCDRQPKNEARKMILECLDSN